MKKGDTIKVTVPKRLFDIIQSTVEIGLFSSNSEFGKTAIIEYLDKMHLLDQLKNSIETKPLD